MIKCLREVSEGVAGGRSPWRGISSQGQKEKAEEMSRWGYFHHPPLSSHFSEGQLSYLTPDLSVAGGLGSPAPLALAERCPDLLTHKPARPHLALGLRSPAGARAGLSGHPAHGPTASLGLVFCVCFHSSLCVCLSFLICLSVQM